MKLFRFAFVTVSSLTLLTGCWDRTEINDLAFVNATGVDRQEENRFRVSIQTPLPGAMGGPGGGGGGTSGNKPYYVDSGIGRNVREANDDLQQRMSRELYFAHRRILVIGEDLAKAGFKRTLDVILEHPESRLSTFVLISKGDALDILTSSPHFEQLPGEALRELTKTGLNINTRDVLNNIARPGKDPVVPLVKTVTTKNEGDDEKKELQIDGAAIFKEDILQFMTNKEESLGLSWLLKEMQDKSINVPIKEDSELNLNIQKYNIKTSYKVKNNLPEFTIKFKVNTVLLQNEPDIHLEDPNVYQMATKKMEQEIKKQVNALINHAKSEGVDPYGLGWHIYRYENMLWEKELSDKWRELLPDIKVNIIVSADIDRVNNRGIKIREA